MMMMMFDVLSLGLQQIGLPTSWQQPSKTNGTKLSEIEVDQACQAVKRILVDADVNLRVIKTFLSRVKEKAISQPLYEGLTPEEQFMGFLQQELVVLLGENTTPLRLKPSAENQPALILVCGLQGSGKTTTSLKLAQHLASQQGKKPLLVAADITRPAAILQLQQGAEKIGMPVFTLPEATSMQPIVEQALAQAIAQENDVVIVDTAGRLQVDTDLMADLLLVQKRFSPSDVVLVMDGMLGQEAVNIAEAFNTQIKLTGAILTKLDGDSRGGAILSLKESTGLPIHFIGVGETAEDLEVFHPDRIGQRIFGQGDLMTLFEKAQQAGQGEAQQRLHQRMMSGQFDYTDYVGMLTSFKKLGSASQLLGMLPIPGLNDAVRSSMDSQSSTQLKQTKAIVGSMTKKERTTPSLLHSAERAERLAKGAGVSVEQVKAFINQFETLNFTIQGISSMTKLFSGGGEGGLGGLFGGFGGGATAEKAFANPMVDESANDDDDGGFADFFNSMMTGEKPKLPNAGQSQKTASSGQKPASGFMNQFFKR